MRIIYMGTPEFAAIALSAIVKEHEVVAVVTQPDKPQGRNRKLVPTPVKVKALIATANKLQIQLTENMN